MTIRHLISTAAALILVLMAACSAPPGNAANGKRWFMMHNCSACHGPHANDGKAKKIAGLDMGFYSFVRFLRHPSTPSMPPFGKGQLSRQDAADIYAWLRSQPR